MRTPFYRLWDAQGKPIETKGCLPQHHGLRHSFKLDDFSRANGKDTESNQMKTLDWINETILSDEYKFTFQDFLFENEPNTFIEYPVENFDKEFNVDIIVRDALNRREHESLPEYAKDFLQNKLSIIGFLTKRAENAHIYIEEKIKKNENGLLQIMQQRGTHTEINTGLEAFQRLLDGQLDAYDLPKIFAYLKDSVAVEMVNDLLKYRFVKWMFHPIFLTKDNFFIKIPLFHQKLFLGWDFVFFNGKTFASPKIKGHDPLKEMGKRLDREVRNLMSLRVSRRMERLFPPPSELIVNIRKDVDKDFCEDEVNKIRKKS